MVGGLRQLKQTTWWRTYAHLLTSATHTEIVLPILIKYCTGIYVYRVFDTLVYTTLAIRIL